MATTYEPIATTTLGSAASSITFSSIAASWTDLRLVISYTTTTAGDQLIIGLNGVVTGTSYSCTQLGGNGSTASSYRNTNYPYIVDSVLIGSSTTIPTFTTLDIMSYANTSVYKTSLLTSSNDQNGSGEVWRQVWLYRSTSAISSLTLKTGSYNFKAGTTATLYGIKAA